MLCRNLECCCPLEESQEFCDNCNTPTESFLQGSHDPIQKSGCHVGCDSKGYEVHIPIDRSGYAFYGVTGMGKTTLAMKVASRVSASGIKLLILDPEGEWKNLMPHLHGKTEYYATLKNLKINPFDLKDKGIIKQLLRESVLRGKETEQDFWDLSPQMNFILDECIDRSNSIPELINNVLHFRNDEIPLTLTAIDKSKTALLVRLLPYKNNEVLREIFYCDRSTLDFNSLDDRNIVIDLHPLAMLVAYVTELRLLYNVITIAGLRRALSKTVTDRITNMLIAEEAQMLVPRILQKVLVTDTFATTNFVVLLRKRGMATMICSQSPSNIEDDIRKNIAVNVIHRLQSPDDAKLVAGLFGYSHYARVDHISRILASLRPRQAIVKVLDDRPVLLNTKVELFTKIDESVLASYIQSQQFNYSDAEEQFIASIQKHPFIGVVERRAMLGWDEARYSEVVNRLVTQGIIEKQNARLGQGRPRVLYNMKGAKPSAKHEFYVFWIIDQLASRRIVCRAEKVGPDIQIPSLNVAINVELGSSNIYCNIPKALKDYAMVIVCSDDKKVLDSINQTKAENVLCALVQDVPALFGKMRFDSARSGF